MFYDAADQAELVKLLQGMLNALGITDDGGKPLGIDGVFGNRTEQAVKRFQSDEKNRDTEGNPLKVDGLVGPGTADTLNRRIVGFSYDCYQTPEELAGGKFFLAATPGRLEKGITLTPNGGEVEAAATPTRRKRSDGRPAFENIVPALQPGSFPLKVIDDGHEGLEGVRFDFEGGEAQTRDDGLLVLPKKEGKLSLVGKV